MIASISGQVIYKGIDHLVVETNGIGYKVFVVNDVIVSMVTDESVKLFTQLVVREDSQSLYGFLTMTEFDLFNLLVSVSGVGPKIAIAILSAGKIDELRSAIGCGDSAIFMAVGGIGKKTAERIILELKTKVGEIGINEIGNNAQEVINALAGLGYNMYEIREVLRQVSPELSLEAKIKEALKLLG